MIAELSRIEIQRRTAMPAQLRVSVLATFMVAVMVGMNAAQAAEIKVIGSVAVKEIVLDLAITLQPGASTKATMKNPMICECSRGTLAITQDGKEWTAKTGDIWTCKEGLVEERPLIKERPLRQ
jgi:hypothetical protein